MLLTAVLSAKIRNRFIPMTYLEFRHFFPLRHTFECFVNISKLSFTMAVSAGRQTASSIFGWGNKAGLVAGSRPHPCVCVALGSTVERHSTDLYQNGAPPWLISLLLGSMVYPAGQRALLVQSYLQMLCVRIPWLLSKCFSSSKDFPRNEVCFVARGQHLWEQVSCSCVQSWKFRTLFFFFLLIYLFNICLFIIGQQQQNQKRLNKRIQSLKICNCSSWQCSSNREVRNLLWLSGWL